MADGSADRTIRTVVEEAARTVLTTDNGSIFSRKNIFSMIRHNIAQEDDNRKQSLVKEYEAGNLDRRQFLKLLGFGLGGASIAATGTGYFMNRRMFEGGYDTLTGHATRHDMTFNDTVTISGGSGADIANAITDNTLVEVEPGTYTFTDTHRIQANNCGIIGTGSSPGDVEFTVPDGRGLRVFDVESDRDVLMENFSFDHGEEWDGTATGTVFRIHQNGTFRAQDVHWKGKDSPESISNGDPGSYMNLYVYDDAKAILDGVVIATPSLLREYKDNNITIFTGGRHPEQLTGDIHVRNCHFENRGSHAMYTSRIAGNVHIENSFFKNNQNTHARIAGESTCKNSTFVWDLSDHPNKGEYYGMSGLRLEAGHAAHTMNMDALVENCDFVCRSIEGGSRGCVAVGGSHGKVTVRDSRFTINSEMAPAVSVDGAGDAGSLCPGSSEVACHDYPPKPWEVVIENVHITGEPKQRASRDAVIMIDRNRDGSIVRNGCIDTGGDADGIIIDGSDVRVEGNSIAVAGEPLVTRNGGSYTGDNTIGSASCEIASDANPVGGATGQPDRDSLC